MRIDISESDNVSQILVLTRAEMAVLYDNLVTYADEKADGLPNDETRSALERGIKYLFGVEKKDAPKNAGSYMEAFHFFIEVEP
jgi:hypothetical protein